MNIDNDYSIIGKIRFYTSEQGGRKTPFPDKKVHGCILVFNKKNYDCFMFIEKIKNTLPEEIIEIQIKILDYNAIKDELRIGDVFYIRELNIIAEGHIIQIFN